ncbi:hypothetical protein ACFQX6_55870 [Streptosporangium lutulentum]
MDLRPAPGDRICSISWPVDALLSAEGTAEAESGLEERLHASGQRVIPRCARPGWPVSAWASGRCPSTGCRSSACTRRRLASTTS